LVNFLGNDIRWKKTGEKTLDPFTLRKRPGPEWFKLNRFLEPDSDPHYFRKNKGVPEKCDYKGAQGWVLTRFRKSFTRLSTGGNRTRAHKVKTR